MTMKSSQVEEGLVGEGLKRAFAAARATRWSSTDDERQEAYRDGWNAALEQAAKLFDGAWGYDDGLRKGVGMRTVAEDSAERIRALKRETV
jgi:hypothetical protein